MSKPNTKSQRLALAWLHERGGDGVFDKYVRLVAMGECAPYAKSTWNRLDQDGFIEYYTAGKTGKAGGVGSRVRITEKGRTNAQAD